MGSRSMDATVAIISTGAPRNFFLCLGLRQVQTMKFFPVVFCHATLLGIVAFYDGLSPP
jgi:hypothetical protein